MELENQTPYPAGLFGGCIDEERICAGLVARCTYKLSWGRLDPLPEQTWQVSPGPWDSPYGKMPGDDLFYRGGVDLFVFGSARAPKGKRLRRVDVTVEVGEAFRHTIAVFGNRTWQRRDRTLVPSEPEPITEVPLTIVNAFGGKDEWDELQVPFPSNPEGKGFFVSEEGAEGKPLPNIENPSALIQRWSDQPEPVGVGLPPPMFGPRVDRAIDVDAESGAIRKIRGMFFNAAFPAMIVPHAEAVPGARVRVSGVSESGPVTFVLPSNDLRVRLRFGDEVSEVEPFVDQIGIEVDLQRVFVGYRYAFRYRMIPLQKRECVLVATA